jgi:hypothetical protein
MAALGASYGGYMVNWIQGNTDRFAALVCHDGNLDEYMAYFDTEELWFPEWEHGGTPWAKPEGYREHSPASGCSTGRPPSWSSRRQDFGTSTPWLATFNALQRSGPVAAPLPDENHCAQTAQLHHGTRWCER